MNEPDKRSQHDQQDWVVVADYEDEEDAEQAANALQNRGIPTMVDQRAMSANFVLLVSALQRDEAHRVLQERETEVIDDAT